MGEGVVNDIEHCHLFSYFFPNRQLNVDKKYLKTAKKIDESLILAIVLRNYSTKPSYIFQLKRELKVGNIYLTYSTSKCLCQVIPWYRITLGERPFNLQGRGVMVFSKKYILIPNVAEKIILILVEGKKNNLIQSFLSYNLMLNSGKKFRAVRNKKK